MAACAAFELAMAAIGGERGGLLGLSEGFAAAVAVEAVVMGPSTLRAAGLLGGSSPAVAEALEDAPVSAR
jgi:hypothetical protein